MTQSTPLQNSSLPNSRTDSATDSFAPVSKWGPLFVALGASLWGVETLWRVPLEKVFASDVLVFVEHIICVLVTLPFLWFYRRHLQGIKPHVWGYLVGSAVLGSAVGTFFFTESLRSVNYTVANVLLNIQPLFSAVYARILLGEQFGKGFRLWSMIAMVAGAFLSMDKLSIASWSLNPALWMILVTALCWSFATVAGRAVNVGMSFWVASPLRFILGLLAMGVLVLLKGHANPAEFHGSALPANAVAFLELSLVAGVVPLFLYFRGLSQTPASIASFCEMFQIVAALLVTWGFFHQTLAFHQMLAAAVLLVAVFRINQIQQATN